MTRFRSALHNKYKEYVPRSKKPENEPSAKSRWTPIVDAVAKLIAAFAVVFAAFIANEYQSSMTTVSLLAKREEAESSLRAGMFRDLIKPITGSENAVIPVEREQLMIELLALNFHEHFELKPLMLRVDERLVHESFKDLDGNTVTANDRMRARNSLRSVARRVVQRQIALLTKEDSALKSADRSCIYELELSENAKKVSNEDTHRCLKNLEGKFGEFFTIDSPNQVYKMALKIDRIEKVNDAKGDTDEKVTRDLQDVKDAKNKKGAKEEEIPKEWDDGRFKVEVTINHVCWITTESISPVAIRNLYAELDLISALKYANDEEFIDNEKYNNRVSQASNFLRESNSNPFALDYLKREASAGWNRIQEYKKKLDSLDIDGYPRPDLSKLTNPDNLSALPPDVKCKTSGENENYLDTNYSLKVDSDFTLTNFDFPFTDNTLLADGTRFSIVLDKVKDGVKSARFKIIWFPKDYIAARERPINFADIRQKLGIQFSE